MTPVHRRFSIARFALSIVLQLVLLFVGLRYLLPHVWAAQVAAGPLAFVAVFLVFHLFLGFFEWFFHRYVLHGVPVRWLRRFANEHRHHHSLTPVRLRPAPEGRGRVVLNDYPITREEQFPDSAFPGYALLLFWALFTPLIVGLQWLLPQLPVVLACYAAVAWSMALYEILHAIDHWPYEWWRAVLEHRVLGVVCRPWYGFHLMHHANVGCNESISGFFGVAVADWCFGTYHQPRELLLAGRVATARDFAIRAPRSFVGRLDRWVRRREAGIVRRTDGPTEAAAPIPIDPRFQGGSSARKQASLVSEASEGTEARRAGSGQA